MEPLLTLCGYFVNILKLYTATFDNICKTLACEPLISDDSAFIDGLGLVEGLFRVGFLVGFGLGFVYGLFENCLKAISGLI